MSTPRVLLFNESSDAGLVERHTLNLANQLAQSQALAGLVGPKDSWIDQNSKACHPFFACGFHNEIDMTCVFTVYKYIKHSGANILHCITHRDLVTAALARLLPGTPHTILIKTEYPNSVRTTTPIFRWAYNQCLGVICASKSQSQTLSNISTKRHRRECSFTILPTTTEIKAKQYLEFYQRLLLTPRASEI